MKMEDSLKLQIESWFKYSHSLSLSLMGIGKRPERPEYISMDGMKCMPCDIYSDVDGNKITIAYRNVENNMTFKIDYEEVNNIEWV